MVGRLCDDAGASELNTKGVGAISDEMLWWELCAVYGPTVVGVLWKDDGSSKQLLSSLYGAVTDRTLDGYTLGGSRPAGLVEYGGLRPGSVLACNVTGLRLGAVGCSVTDAWWLYGYALFTGSVSAESFHFSSFDLEGYPGGGPGSLAGSSTAKLRLPSISTRCFGLLSFDSEVVA
jgi:hypothetical protein